MDEKELKAKGRKLDALRLKIADLQGDEKILNAEVAKAMEVSKIDELVIATGRKMVLETPISRSVDVDKFTAFAATLPPEQMSDALDCVTREISVTDAKRFAGDTLDELCATKPGKPRVRIIGVRGGKKQ